MWSILLWMLASLLSSSGLAFWKNTINESKLTTLVFNFLGAFLWIFAVIIVYILFDFNYSLLTDYKNLLLILLIVLINLFNTPLEIYICKTEKLSTLLPYSSLDKIFIIILWYILFYNSSQSTSIITVIISLLTIWIITYTSIDFWKLVITKKIILYFLYKFFRAITALITGFVLLSYSSIDLVIVDWFLYVILAFIILLALKHSPRTIFQQTEKFYYNRLVTTVLAWSWYILSIYLIKDLGVIVATLLGFFWIVFSVLSMKYISKDNPNNKQIIVAFFVLIMIAIWYYFK